MSPRSKADLPLLRFRSGTVTDLRDRRLRSFFGERYDHRKNLVDWDYTNRLKEVASIIHHTQYRCVKVCDSCLSNATAGSVDNALRGRRSAGVSIFQCKLARGESTDLTRQKYEAGPGHTDPPLLPSVGV